MRAPVRARGRARVEKIIAATAELLTRREIDDLGIAEIADAAGVGRSSVYEFFPTVSAILHVLAERYACAVVARTGRLLVDLDSHALGDIVDILLDGSADFWNEEPAAAKLLLGSDARFSLKVMIKDLHRAGAAVYHQWHKPDWPYQPMSDEDPFCTLSVMQYALYSESVQRHGRITDHFRQQTKLIAHAYLARFTTAIRPLDGN
jgi:AcrR family transcriptional regulator